VLLTHITPYFCPRRSKVGPPKTAAILQSEVGREPRSARRMFESLSKRSEGSPTGTSPGNQSQIFPAGDGKQDGKVDRNRVREGRR